MVFVLYLLQTAFKPSQNIPPAAHSDQEIITSALL